MEQRIDSNTKPEFAAGTDPAYIPGLTAPAPVRTEAEAEAEESAAPEGSQEAQEAAEPAGVDARATEAAEPAEGDGAAAVEDAAPETEDASPEPDDASPEPEGAAPDGAAAGESSGSEGGRVFEVSDRRGSIRVDASGVRFRLDDQEAEFDWPEIGAVEVKTGRFGRRFTVTVHLSSRRWFNAEVEAGARSELKTWTAELDEVLDAYFEEA